MMQGGSLDIIRTILTNGSMPRQRFQNPKVNQSKNGSYYIRPWVDIVTPAGLVRQKKTIVLGPREMGKRAAVAKKNEVMKTINRADYIIQSQIPFGQFLDEYLVRHVRRVDNLAASTQAKYEVHVKNHIRPAFGSLLFCEVTALRISEWMQMKASTGMSWATRSDVRNILSSIFTQAIAWGFWKDRNPVEDVSVGKKRAAREKRKLTDEQTRRFLAGLPGDVCLMCCTGLFCTLRVSEMLGLQEKHLDLERGLILVRQRYWRGDLDVTKGEKSNRDVPMGYLADQLKKICTGDPERFVFQIQTRPHWGARNGICRDDRAINQHFLRPLAKQLGFYFKGFGFHSLRREAITGISREAGIEQAMHAAGHTNLDMTMAYELMDREQQEKGIRAYQERILGKPKGGIQ
jgi:integrase